MSREHSPLCDTRLGPEFRVANGEVVMTLHVCVGFECLDNEDALIAEALSAGC